MKRKLRAALLLLLATFVVVAWAEDPWKSKPASEWTRKDVDKILTDSPWTQIVNVPTSWARTGGEKWEAGPSPTGVRIGKATVDVNPDRADEKGVFLLRWESSRTIRAALARQTQLRGLSGLPRSRTPAGDKDFHVLVLVWDPFVLREPKATEAEAASGSSIKPRMLNAEVPPDRVEYRRDWHGRLQAVAFYFPRKTAGGRALIDGDEDRVDFTWHVGAAVLHGRFNPRKMVAQGRRDWD
jgi:hypothetical protein